MTWCFNPSGDWTEVEIYDHYGDHILTVENEAAPTHRLDSQGAPVLPDIRKAIVEMLTDRSKADMYAFRVVAEALTGANFEEGTPP